MGRIGIYTEELVNEICKNIAMGCSHKDTYELLDISHDTFYSWMREKPEFEARVKRSEAECKRRNIGIIQKAAIDTWTAAAWWLERRYRDEYALKSEVQHTGEIQRKIIFVMPDQLKNSAEDRAFVENFQKDVKQIEFEKPAEDGV